MVFYIIAAAEKDNSGGKASQTIKYVPEATTVAKIKATKSFTTQQPSEMYPINVR